MEINLDTEYASRDEIYDIQSRNLRELVLRCWEHVPFYRRTWAEAGITPDDIKEASDIKKLPFVTKQDIVANLAAYPPFGDFQGDYQSVRIRPAPVVPERPNPFSTPGLTGITLLHYGQEDSRRRILRKEISPR